VIGVLLILTDGSTPFIGRDCRSWRPALFAAIWLPLVVIGVALGASGVRTPEHLAG